MSDIALTDMIENLFQKLADREQRELDRQAERARQGLPSWDVMFSRAQWDAVKEPAIEAGYIIRNKDHYVCFTNAAPPARVMIYGNLKTGEQAYNQQTGKPMTNDNL